MVSSAPSVPSYSGTVLLGVRLLTIRAFSGTASVTSCVGRGTDSYSTPSSIPIDGTHLPHCTEIAEPRRGRLACVIGIAVATLVTGSVVGQGLAHAQTRTEREPGAWTAPRNVFGQPDLEGVWDFATITRLERPDEFKDKEVLTAEESAQYERERFELVDHDTEQGATSVCEGTGNYNEFWYDRGYGNAVGSRRTSLIIDPPDGKIPSLTPEVRTRPRRQRGLDSWEDRPLAERCLVGFNSGPPMMPSAYNNYVQLIQAPDHVVIFNEMIHDARVVPLDGRPHLPARIRQWMGDSRGRWEGETLVVETANFSDRTRFRGSTEQLRLTERFTRVDADTLRYEFTVDDPTTFTRPWTARIPMTRSNGVLYEYACHEGNYGITNILSGARAQEKTAEQAR